MDTLMGVLIGGGLGYMLGDQKDAKKVAGREIWAAAGAVAGHLVQGQLGEGASAPSPEVAAENAHLRRQVVEQHHQLAEQSRRHRGALQHIDQEVNSLIAAYESGELDEELEEAPTRRVVDVGRADPRAAQAAAQRAAQATRSAPQAKPRRRERPALPDYGVREEAIPQTRTREYAHLDQDADAIFGR